MKKYSKYFIFGFVIIAFLCSICFIPIKTTKFIPLIEEQVEKDLGTKIHIETLILRLGPQLKVKTPIIHLLYEDGQKFAQIDKVKFYIPWHSLIKNKPVVNKIKALKLTAKLSANDKYLNNLIEKFQSKNDKELPNLSLKEYSILYNNTDNNDKYKLEGHSLKFSKNYNTKKITLKTNGEFDINNQKYLSYDIVAEPDLDIFKSSKRINIIKYIEQIKELDFHSDIIADIKLYKNNESTIQASGFINIDNISVLDKSKKAPKSFIYLTLWGDKASILSNIYATTNKKVYIEGMVNNSKKPILDIKVKTDDINISDLYQKLKIFSNFSQLKNIQSVNGSLNANFTLKGDLNKIKSNGYLKISNASLKADSIQIDNINSDIDFSNNTINIIKAIGYVNNSPIIVKGNITKDINIELLMNKVELKHLCPSTIGVQEGVLSLITKLSGSFNNIIHKENLLIENLKITNKFLNLNIDSIKLDTNKNNIAYINNIFCNNQETETIKIPSMQVLIDNDKIKIPDTNIYMQNSKLTLKGEAINYNNNNISFISNLSGFINSKDIKKLSIDSARYPVLLVISGNKYLQNANAQVLLEKTDLLDEPTVLNIALKQEKNIVKIEDISLVSFIGKFTDDFKANTKGNKRLIITGLIENIKSPILKNIRVFIPQQLCIHIKDTIAQVKGDFFINGKAQNPDIIGQLFINNLFNQSMQLSLQNSSIDFNKNNLIINAPVIKLADTILGINGLVSTDITNGIIIKNINIKSKYINTDSLLMYKDMPAIKTLNIKVLDGKFYAERLLLNIYNSPLYLTGFMCDFGFDNNTLQAKNIISELNNGKISGSFNFNLRDENFISKIMGRNISAEPIFAILSTRKDTISGTMDFDSDMNGNIASKNTLNGNLKFIINNGRLSTLGRLEHLLYAQNVIADNMLRTSLSVILRAITLKDTGLFKYLRGDVELNNGLVDIKMLQSQGPLMALYIKGIYNPQTDYANLTVLGRLSDEIVSGLGVFGDFSFNKLMIMLTGEESKNNLKIEDFEKIPQLASKSTKEFRSIINGIIDKPSSVLLFNWISYSQKSLKQKEIPQTNVKIPDFIEALPF